MQDGRLRNGADGTSSQHREAIRDRVMALRAAGAGGRAGLHPDEHYAQITCALAYDAVQRGNFGVGCVLVDASGQIVAQGHNEMFVPHFRSDRHAEMVVMDRFEDGNPAVTRMRDYTIYTSLEPCPMCLTRLITSGVGTTKYVAPGPQFGMANSIQNLPPAWIELANARNPPQSFVQADVPQDLVQLALDIFLVNADELSEKVAGR